VSAIASITRTPADLLEQPCLGRLQPGARPDLVVMDDQLRVRKVMKNGRWCR
jgi:N-acetylglucosamine-6-phosphate deacetylase